MQSTIDLPSVHDLPPMALRAYCADMRQELDEMRAGGVPDNALREMQRWVTLTSVYAWNLR